MIQLVDFGHDNSFHVFAVTLPIIIFWKAQILFIEHKNLHMHRKCWAPIKATVVGGSVWDTKLAHVL